MTAARLAAPAAVGFRVKSGWSIAALVAGTRESPALLDVRRVELSDPAVPDSRQPFHATLVAHTHASRDAAARLVADVRRFAASSLDDLFAAYAGRGPALVGAGIVVGSQVDPSTIANDHIRAHAEEGRLFRTVVSDAAARAGISVVVHVEKTLLQEAAHALERSTDRLKIDVIELGRGHEGPWRADEKHAALAAWLALPRSRE